MNNPQQWAAFALCILLLVFGVVVGFAAGASDPSQAALDNLRCRQLCKAEGESVLTRLQPSRDAKQLCICTTKHIPLVHLPE